MKPMEETGTDPDEIRELRSLHDIVSEISDRRFDAAFGDDVSLEAREKIQEHPDRIESWEDFDEAARRTGVSDPEAILGFSTRPEGPAHIREGSVPVEVATKIHEDIHRSTHPETLHEMGATKELRGLYEGLTEYLTQIAVEHLHGNAEAAYPQELARAERLAAEVGDEELRGYLFRHEFSEEIEEAIRRL